MLCKFQTEHKGENLDSILSNQCLPSIHILCHPMAALHVFFTSELQIYGSLQSDSVAITMVEEFLRSNHRTTWWINPSMYMHTSCPELLMQHMNTTIRQANNTCQYPVDTSLMGISMYKQQSPKSSKIT